ncbi:MAG: hypothetical protein RSD97_08210 [Lachnospiraceae bacterium]
MSISYLIATEELMVLERLFNKGTNTHTCFPGIIFDEGKADKGMEGLIKKKYVEKTCNDCIVDRVMYGLMKAMTESEQLYVSELGDAVLYVHLLLVVILQKDNRSIGHYKISALQSMEEFKNSEYAELFDLEKGALYG